MKARMTELMGIGIVGAAMLLPAPRITVQSPRLLYALAMYKTAIGDTNAAVRLFYQAESRCERLPATTAQAVSRTYPDSL